MGDLTFGDANERLLVRLGFDLHDGPLQQVHVLAQDVRLLREQVERVLDDASRKPVLGCFADLESQLAELHRDLRDLAHSLEPRALLKEPLPDAVARELAVFGRRTEISTSLTREGSFDGLTDSQRIALLRVLQEALSNVRQHSGARSVRVALADDESGTRLEICDDGRGFDTAGRASGLGLIGMRERLRLLDGGLEVTSGNGDGTRLVATLPRWRPPS
jgi:signal transduction histidine kinase